MFRACGLHSGHYRIMATAKEPGNTLSDRISGWAATAIGWGDAVVTDRDILDLKVLPRPRIALIGDTAFDPPPQAQSADIQISLRRFVSGHDYADVPDKPTAGGIMGGAVGTGGPTTVPGPLRLGQWSPGELQLDIARLPAGCYIKEATYGRQDIHLGLLRLGEGAGGERVSLVLGCDGATLTARVTDSSGNLVPHTIVYLFAADAASPADLAATLLRTEVTNGWSAPLTALPPGKYLAIATDLDIAPSEGSADDIEQLWRAKSDSTAVEIAPRAMVQVTVAAPSRP